METELPDNLVGRRFDDGMQRIGWESWLDGAGERPAGPSAPAALLATGCIHTVGEMLIMDARIAEENAVRGVAQHPSQRGVGQRPVMQSRFIGVQIGAERTVEERMARAAKPRVQRYCP